MAASNGSEFFELELEEGSFLRPSNAEAIEKDENEFLWAAIERLPSVKRTNYAILRAGDDDENRGLAVSGGSTIDVRRLDRNYREIILKKALDTSEQDNYKLVSGVKDRIQKYVSDLLTPFFVKH